MNDSPKTKKSLGQHWLSDDASLEAMLEAAEVSTEDTVLEIGPGPGTLTAKLVERAKQVIAVEFDPDLVRDLPARLKSTPQHNLCKDVPRKDRKGGVISNLQVVEADILKFDLTSLTPGYKVAANIPYYLTSNLLRILCESPNPFSVAALLLQKEVAERVCAKPGGMSILSVSVQFYCEASLGPLVPACLFTPPPKVDSQILKLVYRSEPLYPDVDRKKFFRIVKAGFAQRRKIILNTLSAGLHLGREETAAILEAADVPPSARAQNLSLDDWHTLYETIFSKEA